MADSTAETPPLTGDEEEPEAEYFFTIVLCLITMAVYILFLKPTGDDNAAIELARADRGRQRGGASQGRQRGGRPPAPQPRQQQPHQAPLRRTKLSDNATEVLRDCQSLPPHVPASSAARARASIGGFDILSDNGLVAFSHTHAAAAAKAKKSEAASLAQRKERAKILSRLFAATHKPKDASSPPSPPSKGSTFVVGVSQTDHLADAAQISSLRRVITGLAAHYTVLVVVSPREPHGAKVSQERTQELHAAAVKLLGLEATTLPPHRLLLAGSATGRVALVRQLSTHVGLVVDAEAAVRDELERFGFEVSVVTDWTSILPPKPEGSDASSAIDLTK